MKFLRQKLDDLLWLFYPSLCAACNCPLFTGEECVCTRCRYHLPRTHFHLQKENPVVKHFWGKVPVEAATAFYFFSKGEKVQRLIHQLKYKGRRDVGTFTGRLMGEELSRSSFSDVDLIVPVPLHERKLKLRGYNQSDCFAEGLAIGMKKKYSAKTLYRTMETETQTKKHRYERFKNVDEVFAITPDEQIAGRHILLVDDVITTGSTLIACAETLLKVRGVKISIAALACA